MWVASRLWIKFGGKAEACFAVLTRVEEEQKGDVLGGRSRPQQKKINPYPRQPCTDPKYTQTE